MVAIARLGAAESLRSGITTVGDYSYAGAAAVACAELGLRAIVYLEVFGLDAREALTAWEQTRERAGDAFDGRVALGVSPHAPYSCSEAVFEACAGAGRAARDPPLGEPRRDRVAPPRHRGAVAALMALRRAARGDRGRDPRAHRPARAGPARGPLRPGRPGRDRADRRARRPRRALPALERAARLRDRAAGRAAGRGRDRRHRHGQPRLGAVVRHVRRDPRGGRVRAGARAAHGRALGNRRRSSSRPSAAPARSASTRRSARSSRASAPTSPSCRWRGRRTPRWRIPPRPSSSVALRPGYS